MFRPRLIFNYWKKIVRSPARFFLTITGLVLAVVLLMSGMILSETYLESRLAVLNPYLRENGVIVTGDVNYSVYEVLRGNVGVSTGLELRSNVLYTAREIQHNDNNFHVFVREIRVNSNYNLNFVSTGELITERHSTEILHGRFLSAEDTENASRITVINEDLSQVLFGRTNSVGEVITLPIFGHCEESQSFRIVYYERLTVVGVISGSEFSNGQATRIAEYNFSQDSYTFDIFVPLSVNLGDKTNDAYEMSVVLTCRTTNFLEIERAASTALRHSGALINYIITYYYTLFVPLNLMLHATRQTLLYVVIFIFVLSGLSIANTMFFSVKERINEIGIRKAIGAFNEDIIFQFLFEGFVYGVVGSLIGMVVAMILSGSAFLLLQDSVFGSSYLVVTPAAVLLSFFASTLIGTLSSIAPAIYSSKINITEALRFD